jgi:hypothetical protein
MSLDDSYGMGYDYMIHDGMGYDGMIYDGMGYDVRS